jgi:hypothetical protein
MANPYITVTYQEAENLLKQQVLNGQNILLSVTNKTFGVVLQQYTNWDSYNTILLNRVFDSNIIAQNYQSDTVPLRTSSNLKSAIEKKLNFLNELTEQLHLYQIKSPTDETYYDSMIRWLKNNRITAFLLLLAAGIVGFSQLHEGTKQLKDCLCWIIRCRDSSKYQINNIPGNSPFPAFAENLFDRIKVGDSYNQTINYLEKNPKTFSYLDSTATCVECPEGDVVYSWKYLKKIVLGKFINSTLSKYGIRDIIDTNYSQLILIYKDQVLVKPVIRIGNRTNIISNYLKNKFKIDFTDRTGYYFKAGNNLYLVHKVPDKVFEIIDFELVNADRRKFCKTDWYYDLNLY